jgi:hypothetical protein
MSERQAMRDYLDSRLVLIRADADLMKRRSSSPTVDEAAVRQMALVDEALAETPKIETLPPQVIERRSGAERRSGKDVEGMSGKRRGKRRGKPWQEPAPPPVEEPIPEPELPPIEEPLPEPLPEPEPELPPPPTAGIIYRDRFTGQQHDPATNGFSYAAPTAGAGALFVLRKDEQGRDVYRLDISADGNDNRNEQRYSFPKRTKLFVGFTRRMSPNFTHENLEGPDNWKQLRLFSEPYEIAGGIHTGFSLLPQADGKTACILFECKSNTATGGPLNVCDNKGTWDTIALPDKLERWGFLVELATGPGKKDGRMQFWLNGVDLMKKQMDKVLAQGGIPFDWNALDIWNYMTGGRNYFDRGFYPGWDNAGSTNPEFLDYHEFVLADAPLAEYIMP